MSFERYNISQLSRLTKTNPKTLQTWIKKGFLKPTQIAGNRKKYSIDAFLNAEKKALKNTQVEMIRNMKFGTGDRIPDEFYDNIEEFI